MPPKDRIEIRFTGGMNNYNTPLDLYLRQKGETKSMINADLFYLGQVRRNKPKNAYLGTEYTNLHTIIRANDVIFGIDGYTLKALESDTTIGTLTSKAKSSICHVGDWLYLANGTDRKSVYIPDLTLCDWGQDIPADAPTVAAGAAASGGTPNGTYACYYRYKITLPDGSIIRTALSPVADITVSTQKIEWSGLVHANFTGATTNEIELFRTMTGWTYTYLVETIASGITTYSDDNTDATIQANTYYDETGYYPPPDNVSLVTYNSEADRVFCVIGGDVYWSEAGLYHIFAYDAVVGEYDNVNSVFLSGENITSIRLMDENMYFGSKKTWRRLRGRSPDDWLFEDTGAKGGPQNAESVVDTPWGNIYPGIDGKIKLFNGFDVKLLFQNFLFSTKPDSGSCAVFDGANYRLFYNDEDYPCLNVDLFQYPQLPYRAVKTTESIVAAFYDETNGETYLSDGTYLLKGSDDDASVAISFMTGEINIEDLSQLGDMGMLVIRANTQGDSLIITPYWDGVATTPLTAVATTALSYVEMPLSFHEGRTLSFLVEITTAKDIILEEPWIIRKN